MEKQKVVLVQYTHPTEVVAGHHARAVAKILREKYGYDVVLKRTPSAITNYKSLVNSPVQSMRNLHETQQKVYDFQMKLAQSEGAPVFDFHCTWDKFLGDAVNRRPEYFRSDTISHQEYLRRIRDGEDDFQREINFIERENMPGVTSIEVPAKYFPLPARVRRRKNEQRSLTLQALNYPGDKKHLKAGVTRYDHYGQIRYNLHDIYQMEAASLKHPEQQKYLHPAISEEIAAQIHHHMVDLLAEKLYGKRKD